MADNNLPASDLSVIVPAFNEQGSVSEILQRLRSVLPAAEIVVVNDGSTDDTGQLIDELVGPLNIRVVHLETNSGKGAAVRAGLEHATRNWVVIQDADLEYDPSDIARLLQLARERSALVVYGSRYKTRGHAQGGAWLNYLGVKLLAVLEWLMYGQWLSDPHTCYKLIRRDLFRRLDIQSSGFELCAEINSKLLRSGVAIPEVPISYQPRDASAGKKIRMRDFFVAMWTYLQYRFGAPVQLEALVAGETTGVRGTYLLSRLLIGCLLLVAGIAKLSPVNAIPLAAWLVLPEGLVFCWGIMEFVLGWACLTLLPHRLLRQLVLGMFMLFLGVLALQWFSGEERCHCLGSLSLPLGFMAMIDGLIVASLIWFRDDWQRVHYKAASFVGDQIKNVRIVVPAMLLVCICWFGSLDAAKAYFAGDNILVDSNSKFAGDVKQNESVDVFYRLSNPTAFPVRVLGAKASCRCIAILDLPTTVEPNSTKEIRLRVKGRLPDTIQRESAELVFDDSALHVVLNATAIVRPNR